MMALSSGASSLFLLECELRDCAHIRDHHQTRSAVFDVMHG